MMKPEHVASSQTPHDDLDLAVLQQENQSLKRAVEELALLNELACEIGASFDSQEIMQTIIRRY